MVASSSNIQHSHSAILRLSALRSNSASLTSWSYRPLSLPSHIAIVIDLFNNIVQNSRPFCGIVTTGTGSHHIVDLEAKTCTCHDFQDYEMPCDHAVALCMKQEREPEDFISPIFTIAEYKATYQSFLHPIDLNVLAAAAVKPTEFLVQAGRPKIRRERRKRFDLSKQRMIC